MFAFFWENSFCFVFNGFAKKYELDLYLYVKYREKSLIQTKSSEIQLLRSTRKVAKTFN